MNPRTDSRHYLPAIAGLRFIGALWVLVLHCAVYYGKSAALVSHGYLGVDLFFVLSGFILSHVHFDEFIEATGRPIAPIWRRFIELRIARLYPAYIAALILSVGWFLANVALGHFPEGVPSSKIAYEMLIYAAMVQSWGLPTDFVFNLPAWTISAEWFAYLLFPVFVSLTFRPRSTAGMIVMAVAVFVLYVVAYEAVIDPRTGYNDPGVTGLLRVSAEFLLGMLTWRFRRNMAGRPIVWDGLALVALVAIVIVVAALGQFRIADYACVPLFAVLILAVSKSGDGLHGLAKGIVFQFLGNRVVRFLGDASYSIYLVQFSVIFPFGLAMHRLGIDSDAGPATAIGLGFGAILSTVVVGCLMYVTIEAPARRYLRKRWAPAR